MGQKKLDAILDEFKDVKSAIESLTWNELLDNWCTLGESDNEVEIDISDSGWDTIQSVYVDRTDDGGCRISGDNVRVAISGMYAEVVYLEKYL